MTRKNTDRMLLATSVLAMCLGCGGKGMVDVHPKFTVDGQPLPDASITFVRQSDEGGRASFGVTDSNGVAQMTTFEPYDGVLPGTYSVVVIKAPENAYTFEEEAVDPTDPSLLLQGSAMREMRQTTRQKRVRSLLPEEYTDPGTTPLECTIDSSTKDLVFDIKTK